MAFLPYLLILTSFLGGAYLVIDATAGERERNSLEPLLATPAKRAVIMSGKIMAACTFGLISLVLTLAMFKLSFQFAPSLGIKLDVSFWALARILLVLLPIVLIGTCLLTLIAAGAKSVKEAQSYMSVLMLVPMLPTIILMVNPVKNQLWMIDGAVPGAEPDDPEAGAQRNDQRRRVGACICSPASAQAWCCGGWRRAVTSTSDWRFPA